MNHYNNIRCRFNKSKGEVPVEKKLHKPPSFT